MVEAALMVDWTAFGLCEMITSNQSSTFDDMLYSVANPTPFPLSVFFIEMVYGSIFFYYLKGKSTFINFIVQQLLLVW